MLEQIEEFCALVIPVEPVLSEPPRVRGGIGCFVKQPVVENDRSATWIVKAKVEGRGAKLGKQGVLGGGRC